MEISSRGNKEGIQGFFPGELTNRGDAEPVARLPGLAIESKEGKLIQFCFCGTVRGAQRLEGGGKRHHRKIAKQEKAETTNRGRMDLIACSVHTHPLFIAPEYTTINLGAYTVFLIFPPDLIVSANCVPESDSMA